MRTHAGTVGQNVVLMDDNARPHRDRIVQRYLEKHGNEHMDWPGRSPDHKPRGGHTQADFNLDENKALIFWLFYVLHYPTHLVETVDILLVYIFILLL